MKHASAVAVVLAKIALLGAITGCGRSVRIGDAALKPFDSMYSIDRARYGLTSLPKTGFVFIEGKSLSGDYDAMLHFGGNPYRTIAFRWDGKTYQWLGEQETFEGPREYETGDGPSHEFVAISYSKKPGTGIQEGLSIVYVGPEHGLETNWSLTLAEVNPLLKRWGLRE